MWEFLINFFEPGSFIPHGHCYLWKPELVWLHIVSDSLIALAYYSISMMLVYFVHKRRDVPFQGIFLMFGAFIVACGTTHLMEVWTLWHPTYWLSGSLKALTAIVSLYTAAELFPLIPQALALPSSAQLEAANQKLAQEIIDRKQVEAALRDSEARFRSIFEGAAIGIELVDMTGRPVAMNPALLQMLGYSENEMDELSFKEYSHPESVLIDKDPDQELLTQKRNSYQMEKRYLGKDEQMLWGRDYYQVEKRYLRKDGQLLWSHITASLVRDTENQPKFIIRMVEDITERKEALKALQQYKEHLEELVGKRTAELTKVNEQLLWQASHDALTGLVNRREFERCLGEMLSNPKIQKQENVLCFLDLDRFKVVNDTCGHVAGDELLRQVSNLLYTQVRQTDVIARLGGDEFGLLLYRCSLDKALQVVNVLHESIQSFRFVWEDKTFSIGVSIGIVAISPDSGGVTPQKLDRLVNAADVACYQAKNRGRNRIHVYQPDDDELAQQLHQGQWITRINQAIAQPPSLLPTHNQFCLYYQPIVPLSEQVEEFSKATKREHYEVLLRLMDETGKVRLPMAFLPAADRYNLLPAIDRWVISNFLAILGQQGQEAWKHRLYSINISGASINDDQFINFLKEQFAKHQVPPQVICFELTETVAIANLNKAIELVQDIKALGCSLALDDFGSGMSSMAYLKHLPVDYLKIDEVLIKDIANDPIASVMVGAISRLGHVIGIETIAEFVVDNLTWQEVKFLGVNYAQGYFIAEPHPLSLLVKYPSLQEQEKIVK